MGLTGNDLLNFLAGLNQEQLALPVELHVREEDDDAITGYRTPYTVVIGTQLAYTLRGYKGNGPKAIIIAEDRASDHA
jgi:hypothetical protein